MPKRIRKKYRVSNPDQPLKRTKGLQLSHRNSPKVTNSRALTVGKVLLVYDMSMQVLPTAPSPTVTHFMNLDALISSAGLLLPQKIHPFPSPPPPRSASPTPRGLNK